MHKECFFSNNNSPDAGDHFDLGDVALLEFISNVPGGSVVGYSQSGDPLTRIVDGEEAVITTDGQIIQEGIKSGIRKLFKYVKRHGLISHDLRKAAHKSYDLLKSSPSAALSDSFNSLHHNETFGTGSTDQILNLDRIGSENQSSLAHSHHVFSQVWRSCRWKESFTNSTLFQDFLNSAKDVQKLALPIELHSHLYSCLCEKKS